MTTPEPTLRARDVAPFVGGYHRAVRLMRSNQIRSWVLSTTRDGRTFRVTVASEVARWQDRQLQRTNAPKRNDATTHTPATLKTPPRRRMTLADVLA